MNELLLTYNMLARDDECRDAVPVGCDFAQEAVGTAGERDDELLCTDGTVGSAGAQVVACCSAPLRRIERDFAWVCAATDGGTSRTVGGRRTRKTAVGSSVGGSWRWSTPTTRELLCGGEGVRER